MTPRIRTTIALCSALLLTLGACSTAETEAPADASTDSATATDGTLIVGSVASISGSAAPYGMSQQAGTELAVEVEATDADVPIRLESDDDASDPDLGTEAFNRLISDGVSAILGPTLSPRRWGCRCWQ